MMFSRIYIHVPFCMSKCPYCAFASEAGANHETGKFPGLILKELENVTAEFPPSTVDSVYFGGGTPSLLTAEELYETLRGISSLVTLAPDAEITIEANPGTVNGRYLKEIRHAGINRVSFGVQSFDDRMLETLGRIHDSNQAREAVCLAKEAGFCNTGIDLIHSIPGESMETWNSDLHEVISLKPEHISIYSLTVEEGTPFAITYKDGDKLPDSDFVADMMETADDFLEKAGYEHYEIANYAIPGFRARHNTGYWKLDGYIGIGPGAHSFVRQGEFGLRFSNTEKLGDYMVFIAENRSPRGEMRFLTRMDAISEFLFLGMRMKEGVLAADFLGKFGESFHDLFPREIRKLESAGLIICDEERIALTRRGVLLSNQVFSMFIN